GDRAASRKAPAPALAGQQAFFDEKITAEVKVGALTGFDRHSGGTGTGAGAGGPAGPGGHRRHGGGGFGMGGMGGAGASGMGPGAGDRDGPREGSDDPGRRQAMQSRRAEMMGSPPVMIHLRFTNTGSEKVDLVIADFLSALGNFVTYPSKLTLEPGQSMEVEPMTSRLAGEVVAAEITLRLQIGSRQETKTITLKPEAAPEAPAPESKS
ncbi:MAG TPA: hypothetical protein VG734_14620, partial [Lacunisphaera sp.]|nr:hypothetical protein [Lacunisphaera sp.]